jgi:hypothetical protein
MDIRAKLQELKSMHDQGLITSDVYAEQQKSLLSQELSAPEENKAPEIKKVPQQNSGLHALIWVAIATFILLGGVWLVGKTGSRETKDTLNQLVSQTGIGTQVVPWSDRAETIARKLIEQNESRIANAVQGITHPTGKEPALARKAISKLEDRIVVELEIAWRGGIVGNSYSTIVTWEISKTDHVAAKIFADSAPTRTSQQNRELLDSYFRTKVYPAFYSGISGNSP